MAILNPRIQPNGICTTLWYLLKKMLNCKIFQSVETHQIILSNYLAEVKLKFILQKRKICLAFSWDLIYILFFLLQKNRLFISIRLFFAFQETIDHIDVDDGCWTRFVTNITVTVRSTLMRSFTRISLRR